MGASELGQFIDNHTTLVLLWLAIFAALVYTEISRALRKFKEINPLEATQLVNQDDALMIDIRSAADFAKGHIINAISLPIEQLSPDHDNLSSDKERPVILYCYSGMTSLRGAAKLAKADFTQVYSLQGGINAWQNENMPVAKGKK